MSSASKRTRGGAVEKSTPLEQGRAAFERSDWNDAFLALEAADHATPLDDPDLDRLALAAALSGRSEAHLATLERLHDLREREGRLASAARAAIGLGMRLQVIGEIGRATAWLARAKRLLDLHDADCVERGYLALAEAYAFLHRAGDPAGAGESARRAAACGERFGDLELTNWARMLEGHTHVALGRYDSGLALMDEAMLAATRGALGPLVTGIVYCAVIGACRRVYAIDRAKEWTAALAGWCDRQPQLVTFHGDCRVHRAEILELQGAWPEAIAEARRAVQLLSHEPAGGASLAHYQQGEILRLRGDFAAAETAYREASRFGRPPQPGLALLRLAQGRLDDAATGIRQAVAASSDPLARTRHLPAAVEILLAAGDRDGAEGAVRDLEAVAAGAHNEVLDAMAAHARGTLHVAAGDAAGALTLLRRSFVAWQQVGAPYLAARVRTAIAGALDAVGDHDGATLERDAAATVFRELGAAPDLARVTTAGPAKATFGLTPRELEVLKLVATGRTNRAISQELFLSEKTVDRHLSNIFAKLDVPSRAAATAFAFRHGLA